MHDLALCDLGHHAILYRAFKDVAEPLGAPALANARQRRMVRQFFVQAETGEPADCEIHLRFTQKTPVMDNAEQENREHRADRSLRIDARPTNTRCVEIGDLRAQPSKVKNLNRPGLPGGRFTVNALRPLEALER